MSQAYQVLSDDKLRASYDSGGKSGVEDMPKMDSSALYAMIFGSEKFEPLIGELKLASQMSGMQDEFGGGGLEDPELWRFRQRKRIVQCAVNLASKLQQFCDSKDSEEFRNSVKLEVAELASSPFGGTLVATIGTVYYEVGTVCRHFPTSEGCPLITLC